ncbi:MAG: zinc-binding dehydrogenase [Actinobacteria bacterium]|nr:zinc-binding dehydrogenase [Actinomycetota bacterium]
MLAARIHELGGPEVFRVEEAPDPVPGPHDLLVAVRATSINHRDVWQRRGHPHPTYRVEFPAILGIDLCADVVETGAEVDGFAAGDRVTISPYIPCGRCENCRRSRPQYCTAFDVFHGTYAELAVIPSALAVPVSAAVPDADVASFSNTYITAWQMLNGKAEVGPDDTVFVWAGTSGLGSAAIEIARLFGAKVVTSVGSEAKRELVSRLQPDLIVNHYEEDICELVAEFTDGRGATIVFEHVGQASWERSMQMCAAGGTIVSAGATTGDRAEMDVTFMFARQLRILGSRLGTMDDALSAARHLEAGAFKPLIAETITLQEIAEGHRMMEEFAPAGKIIVSVSGS